MAASYRENIFMPENVLEGAGRERLVARPKVAGRRRRALA